MSDLDPERIASLRERHRRTAAQNLGINVEVPRVWADQIRELPEEAALERLPVDSSLRRNLQSPVTGELYFMVGLSIVGEAEVM